MIANSVLAEFNVIGACLLDNRSYWQVADLEPADFGHAMHRQAWRGIRELIIGTEVVDPFLLSDHTGINFQELANITQNTAGNHNVRAYAAIVKREARRRHVILAIENARNAVTEDDPDQVATNLMAGLQQTRQISTDYTADESFTSGIQNAEVAAERRKTGAIAGISTTLTHLDQLTGGLRGPKLVVIGGRPGTYKTALAWQIAIHCAADEQPCGFISLEMGIDELGIRALANLLNLDGHRLTNGGLAEIQAAHAGLSDTMRAMPLWIDDSTQRWDSIEARIVEWKFKHDIQVAFVDYLQIVSHNTGTRKRLDEIADITRRAKLLAKRMDIPVVLLSQLNREMERENRRPRKSDLRESGTIEQDADLILFTHHITHKDDRPDEYEIILDKQRGGPAGKIIPLAIEAPQYRIRENYPRY
jgi:replicative DNA helicase